jgi:hypothetical protein
VSNSILFEVGGVVGEAALQSISFGNIPILNRLVFWYEFITVREM